MAQKGGVEGIAYLYGRLALAVVSDFQDANCEVANCVELAA
jgi:hypothetical protein